MSDLQGQRSSTSKVEEARERRDKKLERNLIWLEENNVECKMMVGIRFFYYIWREFDYI